MVGVEPRRCASYTAALRAGHPVTAEVLPTLADGLAVPQVGPHAFAVARRWVDEVVRVEEKDVALAVLRLVEGQKMVVEGGGDTGLAALLPGGPLDRPTSKGSRWSSRSAAATTQHRRQRARPRHRARPRRHSRCG